MLTEKERQRREDKITKLRDKGWSNDQIAKKLKLSKNVIAMTASELIQEGKIDSQKYAGWQDLKSERAKTIIEMVKGRATQNEIGHAIGVTRERARQLVALIAKEHGKEALEPSESLWTTQEAAKELKVSTFTINKLLANGQISCRRRGKKFWFIDNAVMETLRQHPSITRKRVCVICGATFIRGKNRVITCQDKCRKEHIRQLREGYKDQKPTLDCLQGWRRDLWQKLQAHRIQKDEEWLTISQVKRQTGLSQTQIWLLGYRNIVAVRPHPVKKWRGRAVATYAASQMKIAGRVFRAYAKGKGKGSLTFKRKVNTV